MPDAVHGAGACQDDGKDVNVTKHGEKSLVEQEFEYTTKMISTDLSNFSAWHNRSKLIPRLLEERGADRDARRKMLEKRARRGTSPSECDLE